MLFMLLFDLGASNENVIDVDKYSREIPDNLIDEALKGLAKSITEAPNGMYWHIQFMQESKWSDDGGFVVHQEVKLYSSDIGI